MCVYVCGKCIASIHIHLSRSPTIHVLTHLFLLLLLPLLVEDPPHCLSLGVRAADGLQIQKLLAAFGDKVWTEARGALCVVCIYVHVQATV